MSGGIGPQNNDEDRQVVVFTFSGVLTQADADRWNNAIGPLLDEFGASLTAATIEGAKGKPRMKSRRPK